MKSPDPTDAAKMTTMTPREAIAMAPVALERGNAKDTLRQYGEVERTLADVPEGVCPCCGRPIERFP